MAARSIFVTLTRKAGGRGRSLFRSFSSTTEVVYEDSSSNSGEEEKGETGDDLKSRIFSLRVPKRSATNVLQKWVTEGRQVSISDLRHISKQLRNSRRFKHALEISEWLVYHNQDEALDSDYATRIDLMTKVFGIDSAERYFEGLPTTVKTTETYTALLHSYASLRLTDKAEYLFERMKEANISLSTITYNEMMTLYILLSNHKYKPYHPKQHSKTNSLFSIYSPKFSIYLLITCAILFILFQIQPSSPSTSLLPSWTFLNQWQKVINTSTSISTFNNDHNCNNDQDNLTKSMATKLRESVTFLPLKDLRYSSTAQLGHTWFMSSMYDTHKEGEVQYQRFPSNASKGRVLCLKGNDTHDGAWNYYALAWPETLPYNSTLKKGITFVSYNHYNYDNIWHGLSAMVPFVAWHIKNQCSLVPSRWILYHWGEVRIKMGPWLKSLMEATFGEPLHIETNNYGNEESENMNASCFEDAVVMRHNEGGMSRQKRIQVYDLLRCKARIYCNVSLEGRLSEVNEGGLPVIGMTMYLRTGPRSFNNESVVIKIFEKECQKVEGCRFIVAYSSNLTFCEQVKVMSMTDILISPHGAQLTNMFLMDKNSSVLEFFPKGWLKLAGVGQYVYHWIASWSGMKHEGAWRDPGGDPCPYSDDDRRCMAVYKGAKIGYNETYFSEWARGVLSEVRIRKKEELALKKKNSDHAINIPTGCQCSS